MTVGEGVYEVNRHAEGSLSGSWVAWLLYVRAVLLRQPSTDVPLVTFAGPRRLHPANVRYVCMPANPAW
jgi:hypothetical protein